MTNLSLSIQARIVWKESIHVAGETIRFDPSNPAPPAENSIAHLWNRFNNRVKEISHIVGGAYGLNLFNPGDVPGGPFNYMAGVGVSRAEALPEGMMVHTIEAGLYCVVTKKGVINEIHSAFHYFRDEWLPNSAYVYRCSGVEYEYYDERYTSNDDPESVMEIWFPIQPAEPSPVENRAASVFVHVSDLRRSAEWYSKLLGLPVLEERLDGPVYWFELNGTHLLLDSNRFNRENPAWREEMKPRLMLPARDIDAAYAYVSKMAEPFSEPERHSPVSFFAFPDPQGNSVMVCQSDQDEPEISPSDSSPIRRIGGAFLDVKDMRSASEWYSRLFGLPLDEANTDKPIYSIPVTRGAALLLDQNRHLNGDSFTELFYFETDDFDRALAFVQENGYQLAGEPQQFDDLSEVALLDPDGNRVLIAYMKRS